MTRHTRRAAFRKGRVEEARKQLQSRGRPSPERAEPHRSSALVDLANGETARRIDLEELAVRLNPGDERARLALASAFLESEQLEEAEQTLLDTLSVLPGSARAHYPLGLTYHVRAGVPDASVN